MRLVAFANEADWLRARRRILTGSDIAKILGLAGRRGSKWTVWKEKVEDVDLREDPALEAANFKWGKILEEPLCRVVAEEKRLVLWDYGRWTIAFNDELPVPIGVTLDREIRRVVQACPHGPHAAPTIQEAPKGWVSVPSPCPGCEIGLMTPGFGCIMCAGTGELWVEDPRGPGIVEAKTVGAFADPENEWDDEGPIRDRVQVQTQFLVTGYRWGYLAGLLGSPIIHHEIKPVERDDAFIAFMLDEIVRFWDLVKSRTPPPVDDNPVSWDAVRAYYVRAGDRVIELGPEADLFATELADAKEAAKEAEARKDRAAAELLAIIKDAQVGILPGGRRGFKCPTIGAGTPSEHRRLIPFAIKGKGK